MANTGTGGDSFVGIGQAKAHIRVFEPLKVDTSKSRARVSGVGEGILTSIGTVTSNTFIGVVEFNALANLPFLLGLKDMKKPRVTLDALNDVMVRDGEILCPLIFKYGHQWLTLGAFETLFIRDLGIQYSEFHLTEFQLRNVH